MDWHSDIAAGLPERRDDEPRGLREAIVAEIVDHLQCSMRRELLAGRDALEARTRVLAAFGDPVAVACRMWYEAMKERIIMQRLTLAAMVLMTVACTAMSYLVWQGQQDAREFNAALVRKLEEIAASPRAAKSDGKPAVISTPLRVRLVAQKPDGPAVADCSITLFSLYNGSYQVMERSELSDDNGVADFGPFPNGKYRLLVATAQHKYLLQKLVLKSGQGDLTIECPTTTPHFGRVNLKSTCRKNSANANCVTRPPLPRLAKPWPTERGGTKCPTSNRPLCSRCSGI
jgi:hypothetical protein